MVLHSDRKLFEQTIVRVAQKSGIEPGIIESDYYKPDYENNTSFLLYEKVSYDEAKTVLPQIQKLGIF